MGRPITPSPRKPSCAIEVMILSMKPQVLVTKRVYPEAIEYLQQHAEVDYEATDDGLQAAELLARACGKQADGDAVAGAEMLGARCVTLRSAGGARFSG